MRPWLALTHAGIAFTTHTVELEEMQRSALQVRGDADSGARAEVPTTPLEERQKLGSVSGLFPTLLVGDNRIHESLAICEYAAETYAPKLWPTQPLARAQARAVSCEMLGGFTNLRGELPCHLLGRVANFQPSPGTEKDLARIYSLWRECLARSGGPYLFGEFSIADAMYFPVLSRLWTYGIGLPDDLTTYANTIESTPAVQKLMATAAQAPAVPIYDEYLRSLGGITQPA